MAKYKQPRLSTDIQMPLKGKESTRSKPVCNGKVQQGKLVSVAPPCDKDGLLKDTSKKRVMFQGKVYWVANNICEDKT